jgi:glycosyltransferase involved in cell wall biosynthesis
MKILWITNNILPPASKELGIDESMMGGWMYSLLNSLLKESNIQFAVATVYSSNEFKRIEVDKVVYYLLPNIGKNIKYNSELETYWQRINTDFGPDLVHLHGTEYAHGLSFLKSCPDVISVVSIQGLVSVCSTPYYYAGMSWVNIFINISLRDLLRLDTIFQARKKMEKRAQNERWIIENTNHVIGRTTWDRAHTTLKNTNVNYHFCNEALRAVFYENTWKYENCEKHTIFLSQASYPIKGLHQVLKMVFLLKNKYPDIKIKIAGNDFTASKSIKEKLSIGGYGVYIKKEIQKFGLESNIQFMGILNENEMKDQYLKANLFICPSSIENSPNSLGEAQILGVPVIASYVGGVPDFIKEGVSGFMYRFEEVEMLALAVDKIFSMNEYEIVRLSKNEKLVALKRHNRKVITQQMINIYSEVVSNK